MAQKSKMTLHLNKYASVENELSVSDDLLLKGACIDISSTLQSVVLTLLHEGQQGVNKFVSLFGGLVYWQTSLLLSPNVNNAPPPESTRLNLIPTHLPVFPWELLGLSLFHFKV